MATAINLENLPFSYVTDVGIFQPPNPFVADPAIRAHPGFLRESALPFGRDEFGADQANLVYFGGHGRDVRSLINDPTSPQPGNFAQILDFAQSLPPPANNQCALAFSASENPQLLGGPPGAVTSESALGQGMNRGDATMLVLHSSCQMHDRVLFAMMKWSRIGQAFGWEGSPKINDPDWLKHALHSDTQGSVSNSQAWIQRGLDFTKVNGEQFRTAGPSVLVASPIITAGHNTASLDPSVVLREASLARRCHTKHSARKSSEPPTSGGATPGVVVDPNIHFAFQLRKLSACLDDHPRLCSAPGQCDTARAAFSNGRVMSPLLGSPVTKPSSTATNQPAGTPVLNITFGPPQLTEDEIAQKAAYLAESMTGLVHHPQYFKNAKIANAAERDWAWKDVSDQVAYGYHPHTFRARWTRNEWLADSNDVGWEHAALIADGYLAAVPPEVAPSVHHLTVSEPLTAELFEATELIHPIVGVSNYRTFGYLFSVFRKVNGVPVLNLENIAVVHRSGVVWYLATSAATLGVSGVAGSETPSLGSYTTLRRWTSGQIHERFNSDARAFAGPAATIVVTFSEVYYVRNPKDPNWLNQFHVFQFIPKYPSGVVGNTELWGYRVDAEELAATDLSSAGEL